MPISNHIEHIQKMWKDIDRDVRAALAPVGYTVADVTARHMTTRDDEIYWRAEIRTGDDAFIGAATIIMGALSEQPRITLQEIKQMHSKPGVTVIAFVMDMREWEYIE